MSRREFLKNVSAFLAGVLLLRLKKFFHFTDERNSPQPKEAKYYTRGNGLTG